MRELNVIEAEKISEPIPGFTLIKAMKKGKHINAGQYGLSDNQNLILVFPDAPSPEPPVKEDCFEEEEAEVSELWIAWTKMSERFSKHLPDIPCHPIIWHQVIEASIQAGFMPDINEDWGSWFFDRVGNLLNNKNFKAEWKGKGIHMYPVEEGKIIQLVKNGQFISRVNVNRSCMLKMTWDINGLQWEFHLTPKNIKIPASELN